MSAQADKHLAKARALAAARCYGKCEGCGANGKQLDAHHRRARGSGGVHGDAAAEANSPANLLMLCRSCHEETEHAATWDICVRNGIRLPQHEDPASVPARIFTVNGHGWWFLLEDGGFRWATGQTREG